MKLGICDIRPFVRRVGVAEGLVQNETVKSYDHRLLIPLDNGGEVIINGETYFLNVSNVYLITPDEPYKVRLLENQKMVVVNFDWTMDSASQHNLVLSTTVEKYISEKIIQKLDLSEIFGGEKHTVLDTGLANLELAKSMVERYYIPCENNEIKDMMLSGMFMQFICGLILPPRRISGKAEEIYVYMCENYKKPLTLNSLAEKFNFHPTYINRLLSGEYGESFRQLLIKIRLKQAVSLLDNSSLSIQEISNRLGFYDYKHFQQSFKKYYGITPSQYRN